MDPQPSSFCSQVDPTSWSPANLLGTMFCGINAAFTGPVFGAIGGAQETLAGFGDNVENIGLGAQETIRDATTPGNLAGLGAGVTFGGLLAVVAVGTVGAVAADVAFTGGQGTLGVLRWAGLGGSRARSR
jgi:hypothetical protein